MLPTYPHTQSSPLTHGSLFSGIGGFELGAFLSGIKTLWHCELEERQRQILAKHFPEAIQYSDIRELHNPPKVDIISGGFPCQDISVANVSNKNLWKNGKCIGIKGKRSGLWNEMWRICSEIKPLYILFENSPNLFNRGFEQILSDLSKGGYVCEWVCLQASQFGYNHKRNRIYGIAYSGKVRRFHPTKIFRELSDVFPKQAPRQNFIPMPFKRFVGISNNELLRMDDGFSNQLDKKRIEMTGNAVIPEIAHYLFECIKYHYNHEKH